jgi:hypothetical protein
VLRRLSTVIVFLLALTTADVPVSQITLDPTELPSVLNAEDSSENKTAGSALIANEDDADDILCVPSQSLETNLASLVSHLTYFIPVFSPQHTVLKL